MGKREYLITEKVKLDFKKKGTIIFFDEYLQNLFDKKDLKNVEYSSFYSIKDQENLDFESDLLHEKVNLYRADLSKVLNKIHKTDYSEKYWGLILDQFIFLTINPIIIDYPLLKKIYESNKNILLNKVSFKNFYSDSVDFHSSYFEDNRQAYVRYVIGKKLGFETEKLHQSNTDEKIKKKSIKENFFDKILRSIFQSYVKFYKPKLILNSYLGKLNAIKIFLNSFGKILSIPTHLFFKDNTYYKKKNIDLRKQLRVTERDFIDETFNLLIKDFMPASYIENFEYYNKIIKKLKFLPLLGTATSLIYNDHFKYLSAEILKSNGKVITLQHGGLIGKIKYDYDEVIQKKYASKTFHWYDAKSIKENFFDKLKKYNLSNIESKNKILIYPTRTILKANYKYPLLKQYHPYLNLNYKFYEYLNSDIKEKTKIKLFPEPTSKLVKEKWIEKYNKKNLFVENKKNIFSNYKLIILDDFSTPICELLYTGAPFLIIVDQYSEYKKNTYDKIINLEKINVLFRHPDKAADFLNKNYHNLPKWWNTVKKNQIYQDIKNDLLPDFSRQIKLQKILETL